MCKMGFISQITEELCGTEFSKPTVSGLCKKQEVGPAGKRLE
ncbi:hypothetical protein JOC37_000616 [Desulfohalotomaculum tongense]|nr:hypothetical protein [Desulforadius tongensis]